MVNIGNSSAASGEGKKKRKRVALSCSECKDRRIKCDRMVPNCSSCVARGIHHKCRWGDERDEYILPKKDNSKLEKSLKSDEDSMNVDSVVEKVLKRIRGSEKRASSSSPIDGNSTASSSTQKLPPIQAAANLIQTTAFEGVQGAYKDSRIFRPARKDQSIDPEIVRRSLRALPTRRSFEHLIDLCMSDLEPFRSSFNRVILDRQLQDFWNGVEELGIHGEALVWPRDIYRSHDQLGLHQHEGIKSSIISGPASFYLAGMTQQGLIALVFSMLYWSLTFVFEEDTFNLGVFPKGISKEDMKIWKDQYHNLSQLHLSLSDYIEQPTLWSLQTLLLQKSFYTESRMFHANMLNTTITLRLAVMLGLNRLGSAVDDAKRLQARSKQSNDARKSPADLDEDARHNVTKNSFGVTIATFEEGNLAIRELGRKIWTILTAMDFTMGAHMDQTFFIHDNINQTAPPSLIDDDEILSDAAPLLLLRPNINQMVSENAFSGLFLSIAKAGRLQVELENIKGSPLPYEDVLEIDRGFHKAIENFPDYFHYRFLKSDQEIIKSGTKSYFSRSITIQRNMVHEQAQFRLLRLHRLHLGRGFRDEVYLPSLIACFEASKILITARIELEKVLLHSRKWIGAQIHLLHAALVLYLILMYEVDQRQEESQMKKKRKRGHYKLDDLDGTIHQLELATQILRSHANLNISEEWPKGITKLEVFLQRVKRKDHHHHIAAATTSTQTTLPQSPRQAAADILASIPSSTTPSVSTPISTSSAMFGAPLSGDATLWSSPDTQGLDFPYSNDLWSLEALFPDYATNSIDLVDALEKVVWS